MGTYFFGGGAVTVGGKDHGFCRLSSSISMGKIRNSMVRNNACLSDVRASRRFLLTAFLPRVWLEFSMGLES